MEQDLIIILKEFGFPVASNFVLIYFIYKMMSYYNEKISQIIEALTKITSELERIRKVDVKND